MSRSNIFFSWSQIFWSGFLPICSFSWYVGVAEAVSDWYRLNSAVCVAFICCILHYSLGIINFAHCSLLYQWRGNCRNFCLLSFTENTWLSCPVPQVLLSSFVVLVFVYQWSYRVGAGGPSESRFVRGMLCKSKSGKRWSSLTLFLPLKFHSLYILPPNSSIFCCKLVRQWSISKTFISSESRVYLCNMWNLRRWKKPDVWSLNNLFTILHLPSSHLVSKTSM